MNAPPVGISSAWSTIRADAAQQALAVAVARQRAEADEAVLDMVRSAPEPERAPPPPEGQGERVDRRV